MENIPGFLELSGNEFAEKLVDQVLTQGADVESCEVLEVEDGPVKIVRTDSGDFTARSIIIATGAKHRMLGLPNEESYVGNGISFCAVCDGAFYRGATVGVVGGGNSALQEALLLSELAKEVYVIQNLDFLTGEEQLQLQLRSKSNVHIILGTVVEGFHGDGELTGVRLKTVDSGECNDLWLDGLFVAIGLIPQNDPFANVVALDERGYAKVDETCCAGTAGVFVAGDCRTKRIRQVATAAADGAVAALAACDYVDALNK